jgi:galactosamine-6-phosphate isomerase
MQIIKFDTPEALDEAAPTGAYRQLVQQKKQLDTAGLRVLKLDEWAGLPMSHAGSCEYYLQKELLQPLAIPNEHYIAFNSEAADAEAECKKVQEYLHVHGPINLCVLGLGLNGHIAFNDPADILQPNIHLAQLSVASLAHPMVQDAVGLTHGYTLGMADILQARTILLLVNGRHKHGIFQQLLKKEISTQLPASLLWLHAHAYCYYCED